MSTILITVPVTLPLINGIGFDGIWFGIFVTVMCTIGLISPPTGMTVFVIQAQHPEIPVARIYLGTLPFLVADFVLVALADPHAVARALAAERAVLARATTQKRDQLIDAGVRERRVVDVMRAVP